MKTRPFRTPALKALFSSYAPEVRAHLLELRELIYDVADALPNVGPIEETIRWGQPSYITTESKSGSLVRIDALPKIAGAYALYFHCQTTLISSFRNRYGRRLRYEGNRALHFTIAESFPEAEVRACLEAALTYNLRKRNHRPALGSMIK